MTDSVFKNMKEKTYFLKPACCKPNTFFKVLGPQTSATSMQCGVTEISGVPCSAAQAGTLTPPLTELVFGLLMSAL